MDENVKKGTTTIGIKCTDAVILASESKSTLGSLIASKVAKKVYQVDDKIAVTTAGGAGDAQQLVRVLKAEINLYKLSRNNEITVRAVNTLLSNVLQGNRYYPIMAMLILGGHDRSGYHVYSLDPVGGGDEDDYVSTGSGSPFAYGVLEDRYKKGMKKEDGIKLAIDAIKAAKERDIFSGGIKIQVCVIDEKGMKFLNEEEIKSFV
ncbi:MAG: archaeal proteasome endopeptidase complex subunit beta [Candidatus Aenigmatarchaeota archaeon]